MTDAEIRTVAEHAVARGWPVAYATLARHTLDLLDRVKSLDGRLSHLRAAKLAAERERDHWHEAAAWPAPTHDLGGEAGGA